MSHPLDPAIEAKKQYRDGLMKSVHQLESEIAVLETEKRSEARAKLHSLASWLHEVFCQHNHTDGCEWGYETSNGEHNWKGSGHIRWIDIAEKLMTEKIPQMRYDKLTEAEIIESCQVIASEKIRPHYARIILIKQLL